MFGKIELSKKNCSGRWMMNWIYPRIASCVTQNGVKSNIVGAEEDMKSIGIGPSENISVDFWN